MREKSLKNYSKMLTLLENIPEFIYPLDPNNMPLSYYKGVGYFTMQKFDIALSSFQYASQLSRWNPLILNNIASTYYQLNKTAKAKKLYLQIKDMFPNYIEAQVNLLAFYVNFKQDSLAQKLIKEIDSKINIPNVNNRQLYERIKKYYEKSSI